MTSLPDRPDLHQLRLQAKELKRALTDRDPTALGRVLASHPKFAGRPAERMEEWGFSLRDAQMTIARELGFDAWKDLVRQIEGPAVMRWPSREHVKIISRVYKESRDLKAGFVGTDHLLLAILNPDQPTAASQALDDLGLSYEVERERFTKNHRRSRRQGVSMNPALHTVIGWAQGIAVGMGSPVLTDEHMLLALVYYEHDSLPFFVDRDELMETLEKYGVATPRVRPPVPEAPSGPWGPWVYLNYEELSKVHDVLSKRYPPGTARWGINKSKWKRDHWYIHAEDEIPLVEIAKEVLPRGTEVEVLSDREGSELESVRAPRRYRNRPPS
ncbi:MAG TPA: Clp protease N-terminal domain-containing protein [Acidimicrobiia bacterium]|nr:Clp protease N-terminal domain-containing protein [Acidimicrobiia bacterium]